MDTTTLSLTVEETHQGSNLLEKLISQRDKSKFCDVIFKVQDEEFPAHRNVLAACSPYFDLLFNANASDNGNCVLTVACKDPATFENILKYIYSGKIEIRYDACEEILKLAMNYSIPKLKTHCSELLRKNMNISNLYHIKEVAEIYGLNHLVTLVDSFEISNIQKVVENDEILEFSLSKIGTFLGNKSMPLTVEQKFRLVCKWVQHKASERELVIQELFHHIDFQKLHVQYIYSAIMQTPLFSQSDLCMYHVLQTLKRHGVLDDCVFDAQLQKLKEKIPQLKGRSTIRAQDLLQITIAKQNPQNESSTKTAPTDLSTQESSARKESPAGKVSPVRKMAEDDQSSWDRLIEEPVLPPTPRLEQAESMTDVQNEHDDVPDDPDIDFLESGDDNYESEASERQSPQISTEEDKSKKDTLKRVLDKSSDETVGEGDLLNFSLDSSVDKSLSIDLDTSVDLEQRPSPNKHRRKGIPVKVHKTSTPSDTKSPKRAKNSKHKSKSKTPRKINKSLEEQPIPDTQPISPEISDDDSGDSDYNPSLEQTGTTIKIKFKKVKKSKSKKSKSPIRRRSKIIKDIILNCDQCSFTTSDPARLESHIKSTHKDDYVFNCGICEYSAKWNKDYYKHMKTHFPGPPYTCGTCPYTCDRIQQIIHHRMTHTDERPFSCSICNMKFRTKNNLTTHLKCHTGIKPFDCEVCKRSFATKGTLEQHMVTHSDLRPYLCDTCGFSTKYQSHLIAHKRIHTGDTFKCQYQGCKYETPKRSQLGCHMRSHMSIRSHICSHCGRAFVEKSHLVRHEMIHLSEKPFKCDQCDYGSTRRDKLKEHMSRYHSDGNVSRVPYKPRKPRQNKTDATNSSRNVGQTTSKTVSPSTAQDLTTTQDMNTRNKSGWMSNMGEDMSMRNLPSSNNPMQPAVGGIFEQALLSVVDNGSAQIPPTLNIPPHGQTQNDSSQKNPIVISPTPPNYIRNSDVNFSGMLSHRGGEMMESSGMLFQGYSQSMPSSGIPLNLNQPTPASSSDSIVLTNFAPSVYTSI